MSETAGAAKAPDKQLPKKYAFGPERYYQIVKGEIQQENELINNRMTWLIYLQTILFAAFFLVASAHLTQDSPAYSRRFSLLIYAVALVSCFHSLAGIHFAAKAVRTLRQRFLDQVTAYEEDPDSYPEPVVNDKSTSGHSLLHGRYRS